VIRSHPVVVSEVRRRGSALLILAVLALVAMPGLRPIDALAAPVVITTAYTTGYTWYDNSPPGNDICCGTVIHSKAGGTGTYGDPITMAAGLVPSGGLDYPLGTRFYMPDVRRYFVVEDSCGSAGSGGCHFLDGAAAGATTWLDRWVGGGAAGDSQTAAQNCANFLTDENGASPLHTLIENPPSNYPVVPGPMSQNGQCTATFGNSVPGGAAPPNPPPPNPPPPNAPPPSTPPPSTPAPTANPGSHTPAPGSTPLPPVANASTPAPDAPAGQSGKHTTTGSSGSTRPSLAAAVRPLLIAAQGLLAPAALALVLTAAASAVWLLWRRRRTGV
jgi:hypothetical protein